MIHVTIQPVLIGWEEKPKVPRPANHIKLGVPHECDRNLDARGTFPGAFLRRHARNACLRHPHESGMLL